MADDAVAQATNAFYDSAVDYRAGSPHLAHPGLRDRLLRVLHAELDRVGRPARVLEVGAGHGGFTESVLAAGHTVVGVEMSSASLDELRRRFGANDRFSGVHDADGSLDAVAGQQFDLVLAVSVLHHVPDYLPYLTALTGLVRPGGSLVALQDPLWYPRRPLLHRLDRALYLTWRVTRGELRRGFGTVARRLRGVYEDNPSDLVEYHTVRQGLDELAVQERLRSDYATVELLEYWSNQWSVGQRLGERTPWVNTFGVIARSRS